MQIWTINTTTPTTRVDVAGALFEQLAKDSPYFTPHPLTRKHARDLGGILHSDIHAVISQGHGDSENGLAYGMLRGWAKYKIPSLGIAVDPRVRGRGVGLLMMTYLHVYARLRGAPAIRLRVYPENSTAIQLYTRLGYVWQNGLEDGQRVGILQL